MRFLYSILLISFTCCIANTQECTLPTSFDHDATYSEDLFVSPDGSDNGDGSEANPYKTLERAARESSPGTLIHLSAGTHIAGQHISNLQGTESQPIKIAGPESGEAVFSGGNTTIQLSDPAYLVLENFAIEGASANGLNIDDGASYETPAHHVVLRNVTVKDIGPDGNRDGIKLSGLDHFRIENCHVERPGSGGSFIDMVGCHDGVIAHCVFRDGGSSGVQAKGGSARILIYANQFAGITDRAINMGGSTGLDFFRPIDAPFEASDIQVIANQFSGSHAAVAFVGCTNGLFANNVIVHPDKWVARILQENTAERFVQSSNNVFANNIVLIDSRVSTLVNIGGNTQPETFRFAHNLIFHTENSNFSRANLPGETFGNLIQQDPLFVDQQSGDFRLSPDSPAIKAGLALDDAIDARTINLPQIGDFSGNCWADKPSIGMFEEAASNGDQCWKVHP
jgi:hypothetical protein